MAARLKRLFFDTDSDTDPEPRKKKTEIGIEYIFIPIVSLAPYSEPDAVAQTRIDPRAAAEHR